MCAIVGTAFRIKRGFDFGDRRAQSPKHITDHVIPAYENAVFLDLRGEMAVADMPGERQQMARALRTHFVKRFRFCAHLYHAPVVKHQTVAVAQEPRFRQIEQELNSIV